MQRLDPHFLKDVEDIQSLEIVPSILELVCRSTGMGFSAIARVTDDKWIACAVKDDINFGLLPGSELQIETTICNEIRDHQRPVVIDEVSADEQFKDHHTPKMYGFQSYISVPIILKDGSFFGTLCAIDPRPFPLKSTKMVSMFELLTDLISFHLENQRQISSKNAELKITRTKLQDSLDDVRQYAHISKHTLQEPLRKLQIFSELIVSDSTLPEEHRAKKVASKIHTIANDFSNIIRELTDFSETSYITNSFQTVDLSTAINSAIARLQQKISDKGAKLDIEHLHTIPGIPHQLHQLFYYILDNALNAARPGRPLTVKVYSKDIEGAELADCINPAVYPTYCKVCIEDNGIGMDSEHLDKIFDLFTTLYNKEQFNGIGMGLSQSKRIIKNHEGAILVTSALGEGSTFSLIFPSTRS